MQVLLTGGAGYVGSVLVPKLLKLGHEVTVIDNLMYGGNGLLANHKHENFNFYYGDIRNKEFLLPHLKDKDFILHLASIVGYPACAKNPELAISTHVKGTKLISDHSDTPIVYASTGSVYGKIDGLCTETHELKPLSLYGQSKLDAENIITERGNSISLRFATAFGVSPRMRLDLLINNFVYNAYWQKNLIVYQKNHKRTFIHVQDIADSFIHSINNFDNMKNEIFNVGSNDLNYSKEEVIKMIHKKHPFYYHFADFDKDPDQRDYEVSYDKVNDYGFKTKVTFEEGLDELFSAIPTIKNEPNFYNNLPI